MAVGERRIDRGKRLAARALTGIGDELREARLRAGLSQRSVAGAAGLSRAELSRVERGVAPRVPYQTIVLVGAALGVDVPLRAFPSGDPVRDAAQLALLTRFRLLLPRSLRWQTEIPFGSPVIGEHGTRSSVPARARGGSPSMPNPGFGMFRH